MNLVSILKTNSVQPRAKRLALRLCRRLLPSHTKDIPTLVTFFMDEIGSRIAFDERKREVVIPLESSLFIEEEDQQDMEEDSAAGEFDDEFDDEEEEEEEEEEEQYSVFLHTWTLGHLRLIEACQNALGQDFFGSLDRHGLETRAQQIIQEMSDEGQSLVKTTTLANCSVVASSIASLGGTVSISAAPRHSTHSTNPKAAVSNRNLKKLQKKLNPTSWVSGQVASSLASEYVCLMRQLMDPSKSSIKWSEAVLTAINKSILDIASILTENTHEKARKALSSLAILGGFTEPLRIGGKIQFVELDGETKTGIVVDVNSAAAYLDLVPDSLSTQVHSPRRIALDRDVTAIPEVDVDPKLFPLSIDTLAILLICIKDGSASNLPGWLGSELRSRASKVVSKLLEHGPSVLLLLQSPQLSQHVQALLKAAQSTSPSARAMSLEKESLLLAEKIWDTSSKPEVDPEDMKVKKMSDTLPYFPYSSSTDLLPTGWTTEKLQGFIFRNDKRKIEFVGVEANPLTARRSYISRAPPITELVVTANAPVPSSIPEFYFEVTIDQTESNGSLVSVGFAPEGSRTWGNGSYRYQANAKKTTFAGSNRRQNDYGVQYRAKSVVGCGWNRDEKTIFFTKDGVDQGIAFTNVVLGKVVPAVGLSKGVHVTVNFGQDPFRFKLAPEGETEEERERRKREEEEKRKKVKEEEEARRKKEKEDERAANVLAAQPLVSMGFDLKMALVALKQTGFSGPEAASNWLVENMNSWNWEDDPGSDKEEDTKEEEKDAEQKEEEKPKQQETPPEKKTSAVETYNVTSCRSYQLGDSFSYTDEDTKKDQFNKFSSDWEEQVIPAIKGFMEKDGFSPFEVEEYLQQIRAQVSAGNEQQAKGIVMQILGDASCNIQFPVNSSSKDKSDKPPVKMEEAKPGSWIIIGKNIATDSEGNSSI